MALLISQALSCLMPQNPLDFRRFPAKKRLYPHGWERKAKKGWTLQLVLSQSTLIRSRAVNWGKVEYLQPPEHFLVWFASSFQVQQFNSQHRPTFPFPSFQISSKKHHKVTSPRGNQSPKFHLAGHQGVEKNQPSPLLELCWVFLAPKKKKTFAQPLKLLSLGHER